MSQNKLITLSPCDEDLRETFTTILETRASKYMRVKCTFESNFALLHQVIMRRMAPYYVPSHSIVVDHIDGNSFNNTRSNLRLVDRSENSKNCSVKKHNKSKYRGVCCVPTKVPTFHARVSGKGERWNGRMRREPYEAYIDFLCMYRERWGCNYERATEKDLIKSQNRDWKKPDGGGITK